MLSDFQQGWLLHHWGSPVPSRPHPHGAAIPTSYRDYLQLVWSSTDNEAGGRKLEGGCHSSGEGAAAKDLNRPMRQGHRPGTMAYMGGTDAITEWSVPKSPFSKPGLDQRRTRRLGPCQKRAGDTSEEGQRSSWEARCLAGSSRGKRGDGNLWRGLTLYPLNHMGQYENVGVLEHGEIRRPRPCECHQHPPRLQIPFL